MRRLDPSHGLKDIQIIVFGEKWGVGGYNVPEEVLIAFLAVTHDGFDELSSLIC